MTSHRSPDDGLGVALIGFGFAGRTFHAPLIATTPGLALRVVASRQSAAVHDASPAARVVATPDEAFSSSDVDLVVIATPNDTHAPLVEQALRAGRHVVVDKPFTVTLDDARRLTELARSSGRLLSVYQNRRWDSDFVGIREALASGLVGEGWVRREYLGID